jgi:hypothetical protein
VELLVYHGLRLISHCTLVHLLHQLGGERNIALQCLVTPSYLNLATYDFCTLIFFMHETNSTSLLWILLVVCACFGVARVCTAIFLLASS